MKKTFTSALLAFLSANMFGQLTPNETNPTGFVYDFNDVNYSWYTREYVPSGVTAGSISLDDKNVKYTGTASSSTFQFTVYKTQTTGTPTSGVDISAKPYVFIKLKGTMGDIVKVSLHNKSYEDENTNTVINERYFSGYSIRQKITCSGYSWYKFDFTSVYAQNKDDYKDVAGTNVAATKNHISLFDISNDGDLTGRTSYSFVIDSLVMGATTYTPSLPLLKSPTLFNVDFANDYYRYGEGGNTFSVAGGVMTMNFSATASQGQGINFQPNLGTGDGTYVDLTSNSTLILSMKGKIGDTIRVNFKNGRKYAFIDGYSINKTITDDANFKEYKFDFSSIAGVKDSIGVIEVIHNPDSKGAGTVYLNKLVAGVSTESCSGIVAINDPKITEIATDVYPNPASAGEVLSLSNKFNSVEILNLNGTSVATVSVTDNTVQLPNSLRSGMYILVMKSSSTKSFSKLQVK